MDIFKKWESLLKKGDVRVPVVDENGVLYLRPNGKMGVFEVEYTKDVNVADKSINNIFNNIVTEYKKLGYSQKDATAFAEREIVRIYRRAHAPRVFGKTGLFADLNNKVSVLNNKELMLLMPHLYVNKQDIELQRVSLNLQQQEYSGKRCVYVPIINNGGLYAKERNTFIDIYLRPGTMDELDNIFNQLTNTIMAKVKNSEEEDLRRVQIGCLYKTLINYQTLKAADDLGRVDDEIYSMLASLLQSNIQLKKVSLRVKKVEALEEPSPKDVERIEAATEECNKLLTIYMAQGQNPSVTTNFQYNVLEIRGYDHYYETNEPKNER